MNFLYIFFLFFISLNINAQILKDSDKKLFNYIKVDAPKKIRVAVIDTGIDLNNKYLKNNISTILGNADENNYGIDFSGIIMTRTPDDTHGHGTHVSGIITDINPNVELITLKYYNPESAGNDNLKNSLKALDYAISMGVDIINYSGGGESSSREELELVKKAKQNNILLISAAGNEGKNIDLPFNSYFPAKYKEDNIISVGSLMNHDNMVESSNWGYNSVHILAPGFEIQSTHPRGFVKLTGTSQATAFVTGVASLIKSFGINDYREIKSIILNNCKRLSHFENKVANGCILDMKNIFNSREISSLITQK